MKVSVLTVTYNHEKYVAQAIDSALRQRTDFPYEIVVSEDCSTDGTRAVVEPLAARHPDKVRLLLNDRNLGAHRNFLQAYTACRGEYVALLDGDDYWTAPHKLQRQVEFLDAHPECAFCFHDALMIHEGSDREHPCRPPEQKPIFDLVDLLPDNFIYGVTVLFRNRLIDRFPDWVFDLKIGDWPFYLLLARHGRIGYLEGTMAVYRKLRSGMMSRVSLADERRFRRALYGHLERDLGAEYAPVIRAFARLWDSQLALEERGRKLEQDVRDLHGYARDLEAQIHARDEHARRLEEQVTTLLWAWYRSRAR
jgi:glycosyltransferase involved in cell wall biosynthesis